MAVGLREQIVNEREMKMHDCNFWSDSMTLLQYYSGYTAPEWK